MSKIKKVIKSFRQGMFFIKVRRKFVKRPEKHDFESVKKYQIKLYKATYLCKPNLENPQKFTEKLLYLKLFWKDKLTVKCVDKILAKDYIKEVAGENMTPRTLKIIDLDNLDFTGLPDKFVLKNNHASGDVFIVERVNGKYCYKTPTNVVYTEEDVIETLKKQLSKNYYYNVYEWPYKHVKPQTFAEEYIEDTSIEGLRDYKFFISYGELAFFYVTSNRNTKLNMNAFDRDKKPLKVTMTYPRNKNLVLHDNIDQMIEIAKKLGKPFPEVRVDLYTLNGEIKCGELTFFQDGGYPKISPLKYDKVFGEHIDVSKIEKSEWEE